MSSSNGTTINSSLFPSDNTEHVTLDNEALKAKNSSYSTKRSTVLLIDDDELVCISFRRQLLSEGYKCCEAHNSKQALITAASTQPDVILFNMDITNDNGMDIITTIRSYSDVPVIVLSSKDDEKAKLAILEAGADDFVKKPFGSRELMARIRARLRRRVVPSDHTEVTNEVFLGNARLDLTTGELLKNNIPIHLTKLEKRLLHILMNERGKVLSTRYLTEQIWGPHSDTNNHLRIVIYNLRLKLEDDPKTPQLIITEMGEGYRLVD